MDKHSSLLRNCFNYGRKIFYNNGPRKNLSDMVFETPLDQGTPLTITDRGGGKPQNLVNYLIPIDIVKNVL
jgi:hypothetical protein